MICTGLQQTFFNRIISGACFNEMIDGLIPRNSFTVFVSKQSSNAIIKIMHLRSRITENYDKQLFTKTVT